VLEFQGCLAADLPPSACPATLRAWPTHETSGYKRCMADLTPGQRADGVKKKRYLYLDISASDLRALQIDLAREGGLVGDGYIKEREGTLLVLKKRKFTGAKLSLLIRLVDNNPRVRTGQSGAPTRQVSTRIAAATAGARREGKGVGAAAAAGAAAGAAWLAKLDKDAVNRGA